MLDLFDAYEIRARLAPTLLVLLPLALPAAVALSAFDLSYTQTGLSSLGLMVVVYGVSFWVRNAGLTREPALWSSWGGPPSTVVILSEVDGTFTHDLRTRILTAIKARFGTSIDSGSPEEAARKVSDSFKSVRKRISQLDPKGLWTKHNAEYGFLRNLWGSRWIWIGVDVVAGGLCGLMWTLRVSSWAPVATLLCVAGIPVILLVHRFVLPDLLRGAAFRYAESAWVSFLHVETQP